MRFGTKMMIAFIVMLSIAFGLGGSLLISASVSDGLKRERKVAINSHRLVSYALVSVSGGVVHGEYGELISTLSQLDAQGGQNWLALRLTSKTETLYQSREYDIFIDDLKVDAAPGRSAMTMFKRDGNYFLQISSTLVFSSEQLYFEGVFDVSSVLQGRQYQLAIYRRLFISITILGAVISWILSYLMTKPLRRLSRVTRTIASGDLQCRATVSGNDEFSVLAGDFNNMADRLEENITELRDAMRRQEEFMGGVAHELKTPMTSIIGYADLLRSRALSDDDRRDAANYIFTEGRRLEVLSLKLLDLIVLKRRDFTFVWGNLGHVVRNAARLMQPVLYKNNIKLRYKIDEASLMMEPDLIMSLLLNLIDNARKALDRGGGIHVKTGMQDGICTITVADNGTGISQEELTKIKDAFYRVDKSRSRAQGGVGLGLALCDEIAELHGGYISFESELGKGTRVTVTLRGGIDV